MNFLMKLKSLLLSFYKRINPVIFIIAFIFLLLLSLILWYTTAILPVGSSQEPITVSINLGSGSDKIATILKDAGVIKSKNAFKLYIRLKNISGLQAGKYNFSNNMNMGEIVQILKTGKVSNPNEFTVTFIEGKNMAWIAKKISSVTNNSEDDVFNLLKDETYIDELINSYWFLTDDIKNTDIYYPLEGYLFPNTYSFESKNVSVKQIFLKMLDQMQKVLNNYKNDIQISNYSIHEIITMSSIVELEGIHDYDRKNIASVFYNRIASNMSLGSDVTTYYAFKINIGERDLFQSELDRYNQYNTRGPNMSGKLPIGPISSISKASLEAAIYPSDTNYLYFVADKNGKVYFTKSISEHTNIVNELKTNGLWLEFD